MPYTNMSDILIQAMTGTVPHKRKLAIVTLKTLKYAQVGNYCEQPISICS